MAGSCGALGQVRPRLLFTMGISTALTQHNRWYGDVWSQLDLRRFFTPPRLEVELVSNYQFKSAELL